MRFRLKTLFLVTFLVALVCAVLFALPDWLSLLLLATLAMLTPGAVVSAIIYGRKAVRAFAIGCLAAGGWSLWIITPMFFYIVLADSAGEVVGQALFVKIAFVGFYAVLGVSGLVCIGVRRLCYQGHNRIRPPRDCC
ncbi:MAG TPA: hypothetical protein VHC19_09000 [Pirellulales bacterium]|nr:hypothetical protein [Pirellulales bacterium]